VPEVNDSVRPEVDPILASVINMRLHAISEEMAVAALLATRSTIFNLVGDFITAVLDGNGRTLAQTEYAAIIAFSVAPALANIRDYFDDIQDGDVILHNDVFTGGNQNHDLGVYIPLFVSHELVGWAVCKGHQADMGGATAGGYNPAHTEIWQEAFRIPPLKLYSAGALRTDVWDLIAANVRLDYVMDDLAAMIGSARVGCRELERLVAKYGIERFQSHVDYLLEASERAARDEINGWPNGTWHGESWMMSDGHDASKSYRIACDVTIGDEDIVFDYSGTDDQAPGFTNMPPSAAMAGVRIAYLMVLAAGGVEVFPNHGIFAPVRVVFREGSLLSPRFPAATMFGNQMCDEVFEAAMMALAVPLPDRVSAGWNQALGTSYTGTDPRDGRRKIFFGSFNRGGAGAVRGADGYDAIGFTGSVGQTRTPDVEVYEIAHPCRIDRYEMVTDSAGAGRWRGGYGTVTVRTLLAEDLDASTLGDDVESEGAAPGPGLFGGEPAGLNKLRLEFPDGRSHAWGSKEFVRGIPYGTRVVCEMGGGAGYEHPWDRDPSLVVEEVCDGLCSIEKAREHYGVVLDGRMVLDRRATACLREARSS
jgi:N-methylhydantoinase B